MKSFQWCYFLFLFFFSLISCSYSYKVITFPQGASMTIEGQQVYSGEVFKSKEKRIKLDVTEEGYYPYGAFVENESFFKTRQVNIILEKQKFNVHIDTVDLTCDVLLDSKKIGITPCDLVLEYGTNVLSIQKEGQMPQQLPLFCDSDSSYRIRYQGKNTRAEGIELRPVGVFSCDSQPKQVHFSPDSDYLAITLLNGGGFQLFDLKEQKIASFLQPEGYAKKKGFVECIFIPRKNAFLVSQMTTNMLFEYMTGQQGKPEMTFNRHIPTGGKWPKVISWSEKKEILAVSNWISSTVTIIDYKSGKIVKKIAGLSIPRGLAFDSEGKFLYIAEFGGGRVCKYSTDSWKLEKRFYKARAAMRHIVLSEDDKTCYVSNMYHNEVYSLDAGSMRLEDTYQVPPNPNTIDLLPGGNLLFVSTRGPNNPAGYLERSIITGEVVVIDVVNKKQIFSLEGGLQPTGLDISSDGRLLAFSNFQDDTIEIYEIITQ